MGMSFDYKIGHLYSISEDGRFKVTDYRTREVLYDMGPGKAGLKYMIHDTNRAVFILADGDGFVYVYNAITVFNYSYVLSLL
jgi:hypothetical protein